MSYSPNSLKGVLQEIILGTILGPIKGDNMSLDYTSYIYIERERDLFMWIRTAKGLAAFAVFARLWGHGSVNDLLKMPLYVVWPSSHSPKFSSLPVDLKARSIGTAHRFQDPNYRNPTR